MIAQSFAEYASSFTLSDDEVYTVELLIDRVRSRFDPNYYDDWSERDDAREAPDYRPSFLQEHILPAAKELAFDTGVSFQRLNDAERPVRDLTPLRYLPQLSRLILMNNEVTDLSPLSGSANLRTLYLNQNPVKDLSPLASCINLHDLHLGDTPVDDLSPLQDLPNLRELSVSINQISALRKLRTLPALRWLEFDLETFDSFEGFAEMPQLRVIRGAHVTSLNGLERFRKLENLINLWGGGSSLEPLRSAKSLTHVNILRSRIDSLEPLSGLFALRDLSVDTEVRKLDLKPLEGLPALHEVSIECSGVEPKGLARLRSKLSSWDVEFRSEQPRHTPSLAMEVVDQDTFNYYDSKALFNVTDHDTNHGLLSSELCWLDKQLEQMFASAFTEHDDYAIPSNWCGGRSRTVVLYSESAVKVFPNLVLGMQKILSHAKPDWIIYFQSDGVEPDFIAWIYPDRIMVTEEHAEIVRRLINGN
jgi:hypothetical protein